ncbi:argininosuccinate synthase [Bartonella henselae]|nr:argininosuccinate synthase [Bartonella henselae]
MLVRFFQIALKIAKETGADVFVIADGATGNGNEQENFKLFAYVQNPNIKILLHGVIDFFEV